MRQLVTAGRYSSPFEQLPFEQRKSVENEFLTFFDLCVETTDDGEEAWAYERLKQVYARAIAGADDLVAGFFDAMRWAAQERARGAPS